MPIIFCDYHEYNPLRYSFANTDIASIKWLRVYSGLVGRIIYNLYSLATSIWLASSYCLDDFCIMYDACTCHFTLLQMWHDDLIEFWFFNIIKHVQKLCHSQDKRLVLTHCMRIWQSIFRLKDWATYDQKHILSMGEFLKKI